MRILFLTQIIPYPPDAGPRVKTWHVIRYLVGQGHSVTLASFIRPEEEQFQRDTLATNRLLRESYWNLLNKGRNGED